MTRPQGKYNTRSNWYITISPNPRKIFGRRAFQCQRYDKQIHIIMESINRARLWCKDTENNRGNIYFELNKNLMVHAHFMLSLSLLQAQTFQAHINNNLGSANLNPSICCHLCPANMWQPKMNPDTGQPYDTWHEYCEKDGWEKRQITCKCIQCRMTEDEEVLAAIEAGDLVLA